MRPHSLRYVSTMSQAGVVFAVTWEGQQVRTETTGHLESNFFFHFQHLSIMLQLIVFDPKDHPDSPSGLLEKIIPLNTEIFFTLSAESRYSVPELKSVDAFTRRCFFDEETTNIIPGLYAYGRCLGRCNAGSIFRLCGCLPYYFEDPSKLLELDYCKSYD